MLNRKARRNIADFNKARDPKYSGKRIWLYDDKLSTFVETYLKIKEIELDDTINSQDGEVA